MTASPPTDDGGHEPGTRVPPGVLLLVDDEPDDRTLVEMAVRAEPDLRDVPVRHVRNREELEQAIGNARVAAVVTDHRLCWGNGLEVLGRIRKHDPCIPVIFFTATGSEEVAVAALQGGARDYLTKRHSHLPRLVRVIRQALEEQQTYRKARDIEERWARLFANVPVGLYRTTADGRTLHANEALRTLLGMPPGTRNPSVTGFYQNPRDRERLLEILRRDRVARDFLVPIRGPGGQTRWCSLNAHLVEDPADGEVIEGAIVDVTERLDHERRIRETLDSTIRTLATALEKRDPYTAGHQRRVAGLAARMAALLGFDEEARHGVYLGGLLHDIGKIAVPAEILSSPRRLTPAEYQIIQSHCAVGWEILREISFPWPVAEMVRHHHERMDGSGYPDGLRGDAISREARLLAVADVAEAMASHRPYRPALGLQAAIAELQAQRGRLYDEDAVNACVQVLRTEGFGD